MNPQAKCPVLFPKVLEKQICNLVVGGELLICTSGLFERRNRKSQEARITPSAVDYQAHRLFCRLTPIGNQAGAQNACTDGKTAQHAGRKEASRELKSCPPRRAAEPAEGSTKRETKHKTDSAP